MDNLDLSVIVPCYNSARYLPRCLKSILQTNFPQQRMEIILIDDGSTDKTKNIINQCAQQHNNIRPLHEKHSGPSAARNYGIRKAKGKYIAFVDSDDEVTSNAYPDLIYTAEQYHSDIVAGFVRCFDSLGSHGSKAHQIAVPDTIVNTTLMQSPNLIYDTSIWNKVYSASFLKRRSSLESPQLKFIPGMLCENLPFVLQAQLSSHKISVIKSTVYYKRWQPYSITNSNNAFQNYRFRIKALNICKKILFKHGFNRTANLYQVFINRILELDLPAYLQDSGDEPYQYRPAAQELTYNFLKSWNLLDDTERFHKLPVHLQILYYAILHNKTEILRKITYHHYLDYFRSNHLTKHYSLQIKKLSNGMLKHLDCKDNTVREAQSLRSLKLSRTQHLIYGMGMFKIKRMRMFKKPFTADNYHESLTAELINLTTGRSIPISFRRIKTPVRQRILNPYSGWNNSRYQFKFNYQTAETKIGCGVWRIKVIDVIAPVCKVSAWLGKPKQASKNMFRPVSTNRGYLNAHFTNAWSIAFDDTRKTKLADAPVNRVSLPQVAHSSLIFKAKLSKPRQTDCKLILNKRKHLSLDGKVNIISKQPNNRICSIKFPLSRISCNHPYKYIPLRLVDKSTSHRLNYYYPDHSRINKDGTNKQYHKQVITKPGKHALWINYRYVPVVINGYWIDKINHNGKRSYYLCLSKRNRGLPCESNIISANLVMLTAKRRYRYSQKVSPEAKVYYIPLSSLHQLFILRGVYHFTLYLTLTGGSTITIGFTLKTEPMPKSRWITKSRNPFLNTVHAKYKLKRNEFDTLRLKIYQPWGSVQKHSFIRSLNYSIMYPLMRLLPLQKNTVLFDSYWGRQFSSNERAIYQYLDKRNYNNWTNYLPKLNLVWIFGNNQIPITGHGHRVRYKSLKYWYELATAKYIFQNTNMSNKYYKRTGQIEVETLHGTFLKHMGFDEPHFKFAGKGTKKKLARRISRWDYMVVPSNYMARTASHAFSYHKKLIRSGFPRNDELIKHDNTKYIQRIKNKLGIPQGKCVILYAPTYRQNNDNFYLDLKKLRADLPNNVVLLIRLHYFVAHSHSFYSWPGFVYDVSDYPDINDLYLISDALITDYSSVMFDYAYLKRPMIFYAYDHDRYLNNRNRGTYLDYDYKMPGPIVRTQEQLTYCLRHLNGIKRKYRSQILAFSKRFAEYGKKGNATEKVINTVFNSPTPVDQQPEHHIIFRKFLHIFHIKNFQSALLNYLSQKLPKKNIIIFDSFFGRQYSDNPKGMYLYIKKHYPQYKLYWNVNPQYIPYFKAHHLPYVTRFGYHGLLKQAQAKYWITNARRPFRWLPRNGAKELQTWHGTPLKTLGADVNLVTMPGNNARKYHRQTYRDNRRWSYLLAPNQYSADIMVNAFRMEPDQMILSGYPRDDILVNHNDKQTINRIKDGLHLPHNKKIILYAPTWRDNKYTSVNKYTAQLHLDISKLRQHFGSRIILLVRTHYIIANHLDLSEYRGFAKNVSDYPDIAELYLISNVLITDYSSVMFDYSILKRPMIFFDYDYKDYTETIRGFYFNFDKVAPGKIVTTTNGVIRQLDRIFSGNWRMSNNYKYFVKRFDSWMDGHASARASQALLGKPQR